MKQQIKDFILNNKKMLLIILAIVVVIAELASIRLLDILFLYFFALIFMEDQTKKNEKIDDVVKHLEGCIKNVESSVDTIKYPEDKNKTMEG